MTQTTRSPSGFSEPTTTSEKPFRLGQEAEVTTKAPRCKVYNIDPSKPLAPTGYVDIDDLVGEFEKDDEKHAAIQDARRWLADTLDEGGNATVRTLRLKKGWSQVRLSQEMQSSQSHVARIERGIVNLAVETCRKLCAALDVDMNTLDLALRHQEEVAHKKANSS